MAVRLLLLREDSITLAVYGASQCKVQSAECKVYFDLWFTFKIDYAMHVVLINR